MTKEQRIMKISKLHIPSGNPTCEWLEKSDVLWLISELEKAFEIIKDKDEQLGIMMHLVELAHSKCEDARQYYNDIVCAQDAK